MTLQEVKILYPRVYKDVEKIRTDVSTQQNAAIDNYEHRLEDERYIREIYRIETNISKLERFDPIRTRQLRQLNRMKDNLKAYYTAFIIREQLNEKL